MKHGMDGSRLAGFMPLSDLQQRVAEIVFALDESEGFALAGGGGLIAHDVVDRTTRDLDCFGPSRDAVDRYWPAIVGLCRRRASRWRCALPTTGSPR